MKNILIISYYFPPAAVVGAHRIRRFLKHLPDYGFHSTIVTVDEKYYDLIDDSLCLATQSNFQLVRTNMIALYNFRGRHELTVEGGMRSIGMEYRIKQNSLMNTLRTYLSIPDTRSGWIPEAVLKSLEIIKQQHVDAIITTSYPYSAHIIGMILKTVEGTTWLADFRDPWAEYAFLYPNTELHKKAAYFLERKVIEKADFVIANTFEARDRMRERYEEFAAKIKVIPNGYDQDEFELAKQEDLSTYNKENKFIILHAGTVQADKERRYPESLFQAVSSVIIKHPGLKDKLVLKFLGHLHFTIDLKDLAQKYGIEGNLVEVGYVDHERAIREMLSANVLLLIHHAQAEISQLYSTIPAKTYEYMAAQKPILCLTSNGVVGKIIEKQGLGISVSPLNVNEITGAIENLLLDYDAWLTKVSSNDFYSQFEAKSLTNQLVQYL